MADEDERPIVDGGETEPVAEVEAPEVETQADPIEALASEMGWVPKDQFRGSEDEWRPATDFIKAGRDITRSLSRELRSVREETARMSRTAAELMADKLAERDSHWQSEFARAVQEGDKDGAERAMEERVKLATARASDAPTPAPEAQSFIERNKWFNADPLARTRAIEICGKLAQQGIPQDEQLRQAERAIKKEFPEHFAPPPKAPASVQTGTARNAQPSSRERGFADMPAASQQMARDFEKRHGIRPDEFAKRFWADQAKQRRVG